MPTYLVSGATGFVGGALVRRLLREREAATLAGKAVPQVRVLVRDDDAAERLVASGASAHVASLGDPNAIAEAARGVDVLYHCAAENSHRAAPAALAWINVAGTENVLNAAKHAGVRRVVHLSCTDVTLVNRDRMSWKETRPVTRQALDACARTKLLAEELALQASDGTLQVTVLRPAWVWGPGDRSTLPALCEEARRGGVSLCGSGKNLVPTVYIDNLVDALLAAATAEKAPAHAYHIVDGEVLNAEEFLGQLCACLSLPSPTRGAYALAYAAAWLRELRGQPGLWRTDVARRGRSCLFDAVAAVHDLGYQPRVSVAEGMRALQAWAQSMGGSDAIANTARRPASAQDVAAMETLAARL